MIYKSLLHLVRRVNDATHVDLSVALCEMQLVRQDNCRVVWWGDWRRYCGLKKCWEVFDARRVVLSLKGLYNLECSDS